MIDESFETIIDGKSVKLSELVDLWKRFYALETIQDLLWARASEWASLYGPDSPLDFHLLTSAFCSGGGHVLDVLRGYPEYRAIPTKPEGEK